MAGTLFVDSNHPTASVALRFVFSFFYSPSPFFRRVCYSCGVSTLCCFRCWACGGRILRPEHCGLHCVQHETEREEGIRKVSSLRLSHLSKATCLLAFVTATCDHCYHCEAHCLLGELFAEGLAQSVSQARSTLCATSRFNAICAGQEFSHTCTSKVTPCPLPPPEQHPARCSCQATHLLIPPPRPYSPPLPEP